MKFCVKCGHQMDDDMLFCQKCGTKSVVIPEEATPVESQPVSDPTPVLTPPPVQSTSNEQPSRKEAPIQSKPKKRKAMKAWSIVFAVFAAIYAIISSSEPSMFAMVPFCLIFAIMFFLLSKSPKGNPYMFGKTSGLKKKWFVLLCIVASFTVFGVIMDSSSDLIPTQNSINSAPAAEKKTTEPTATPATLNEATTTPTTEPTTVPTTEPTAAPTNEPTNAVVWDVTSLSLVSADTLVSLIGEPDTIESAKLTGVKEVACTYYEYNDHEVFGYVSFAIVNDEVIRLTSYAEYEMTDDVLAQFGVERSSNCSISADTGYALRYSNPSSTVDDFWIADIENDTFGFLQVTYDMTYYR